MDGLYHFLKKFEKYTKNTDLLVAVGLLLILTVMIIPLPAILLDLALALSLASGILMLLVSLYINKPLEFSVFPSLLLITTLFRLSLNVATTRMILSNGHEGPGAAGDVIEAFGRFVVGNNYVIGFIVFLILVVINFVVITKGAGRVAEVSARFTLDAMPGKQMSIDADLNAGIINEAEAKRRRQEIEQEADFYGAMDGASKFTRGDAIAGIVITIINIVGGLLVGVLQKDMDIASAAKVYTMLTIGDGLLAQIPALVISTAAGIVVTRSAKTENNIGVEVVDQLFKNSRAVTIAAVVIAILALVPGLPTFPFLIIGSVMGLISFVMHKGQAEEFAKKRELEREEANKPQKENIESLLPMDLMELEVGYGLIPIVEQSGPGDLLERIRSIRKQFAIDFGIVVPSVHIRDNLQLQPGEYRFLIKGNKVGGGILRPDHLLAMDPGNVNEKIDGIPTKEPAFGLDAIWITTKNKETAELLGYTVVDIPTVIATHLTELVRKHAHELIGRQEVTALLDNFKKTHPKVVEDLIPDILNIGIVVKVLQNLLKEQISIRDLRTILETLADEGQRTKDPELLTEAVRKALARSISSKFGGDNSQIFVITLDPKLEELLTNSLLQTESGAQLVMDPSTAQKIISSVASSIEQHPEIAAQPILLTSPSLRRHLAKLLMRFIPQIIVLSHSEIASDFEIQSVGSVEFKHAG
jgi:flagellar biosynthesis protein FlhA